MKTGRNNEGYPDQTASVAVGTVYKEEHEADKRAFSQGVEVHHSCSGC